MTIDNAALVVQNYIKTRRRQVEEQLNDARANLLMASPAATKLSHSVTPPLTGVFAVALDGDDGNLLLRWIHRRITASCFTPFDGFTSDELSGLDDQIQRMVVHPHHTDWRVAPGNETAFEEYMATAGDVSAAFELTDAELAFDM